MQEVGIFSVSVAEGGMNLKVWLRTLTLAAMAQRRRIPCFVRPFITLPSFYSLLNGETTGSAPQPLLLGPRREIHDNAESNKDRRPNKKRFVSLSHRPVFSRRVSLNYFTDLMNSIFVPPLVTRVPVAVTCSLIFSMSKSRAG